MAESTDNAAIEGGGRGTSDGGAEPSPVRGHAFTSSEESVVFPISPVPTSRVLGPGEGSRHPRYGHHQQYDEDVGLGFPSPYRSPMSPSVRSSTTVDQSYESSGLRNSNAEYSEDGLEVRVPIIRPPGPCNMVGGVALGGGRRDGESSSGQGEDEDEIEDADDDRTRTASVWETVAPTVVTQRTVHYGDNDHIGGAHWAGESEANWTDPDASDFGMGEQQRQRAAGGLNRHLYAFGRARLQPSASQEPILPQPAPMGYSSAFQRLRSPSSTYSRNFTSEDWINPARAEEYYAQASNQHRSAASRPQPRRPSRLAEEASISSGGSSDNYNDEGEDAVELEELHSARSRQTPATTLGLAPSRSRGSRVSRRGGSSASRSTYRPLAAAAAAPPMPPMPPALIYSPGQETSARAERTQEAESPAVATPHFTRRRQARQRFQILWTVFYCLPGPCFWFFRWGRGSIPEFALPRLAGGTESEVAARRRLGRLVGWGYLVLVIALAAALVVFLVRYLLRHFGG